MPERDVANCTSVLVTFDAREAALLERELARRAIMRRELAPAELVRLLALEALSRQRQ